MISICAIRRDAMVRTVHSLYLLICDALRIKVRPVLIWHWDALDLAAAAKIDRAEFELENGFPVVDILALCDNSAGAIRATMGLCDRQISYLLLTLLHELAHAQGINDEPKADDWALEHYRRLARSKRWAETKIKIGLIRGAHRRIPDDRVWSRPVRLPVYQPDWVSKRNA